MLVITEPTLLLDRQKCLQNIQAMAAKAQRNAIRFRPHFKTHQSDVVGRWFREVGVEAITVSSLKMASYFAKDDWQDITVAFPVNLLAMARINALAKQVQLNVVVEDVLTVKKLSKQLGKGLRLGVCLKIDAGYGRTGIAVANTALIEALFATIAATNNLQIKGFLAHAGHSYKATSHEQILAVHEESRKQLMPLKEYFSTRFPDLNLALSVGDTPTCSIAENFKWANEFRPGNFAFYDLMQWQISACTTDDIAVAMACPVVAKHANRRQIIVHGGAVHFSKDMRTHPVYGNYFGLVVPLHLAAPTQSWGAPIAGTYMSGLSQEHGTITCNNTTFWEQVQVGDLVGVLPIHSCLAANLMRSYLTLDGERIDF